MEVVNSFFLEGSKVFKKSKAGSGAITDVLLGFAKGRPSLTRYGQNSGSQATVVLWCYRTTLEG